TIWQAIRLSIDASNIALYRAIVCRGGPAKMRDCPVVGLELVGIRGRANDDRAGWRTIEAKSRTVVVVCPRSAIAPERQASLPMVRSFRHAVNLQGDFTGLTWRNRGPFDRGDTAVC